MTNQVIDNSADKEFGNVILWQYDKAENLVALIKSFLGIHDSATKDLWDKMQKELDVDVASEFGLSILGSLLGVPWGTYYGSSTIRVSVEHYRKWIKAWAVLICTDFTVPDVLQFFKDTTISNNGYYFMPMDASMIASNVMAIEWNMIHQSSDDASGSITTEIVENLSKVYLDDNVKLIAEYWLYTIRDAINATGRPAAVRENNKDNNIIFGFDGQQYKTSGDYQIGGFDDSTFIPTDEYATETY